MAKKNKKQTNVSPDNSFQHSQQGMNLEAIRLAIADRLTFSISKDTFTATQLDWLDSVSYAVRDRLIERWMNTMRSYYS